MQQFKFRAGAGNVYSEVGGPVWVVTPAPFDVQQPSVPRPAIVGVSDSEPMLKADPGAPTGAGWVRVADLEAIPVDPAAVQTKDDGKAGGLVLWGLGLGALFWGLDKVLSKPSNRPAYANRRRGK